MSAYQNVIGSVMRGALTFMSKRRLPQIDGASKVPGLTAPAEVIRDHWGIPHIYASNTRDLFFTQGFVHAQDRLRQMELNRRTATGRLSEIFGAVAMLSLFIGLAAIAMCVLACTTGTREELVLFDFESDAELDQLHWTCHTLYSLSDRHATHGARSIKLELYPSDYPGLTMKLTTHNWRRHKSLQFDVYNPGDKVIPIRCTDRRSKRLSGLS